MFYDYLKILITHTASRSTIPHYFKKTLSLIHSLPGVITKLYNNNTMNWRLVVRD